MGRLGAVGAVLGAAPCLDRKKSGALDDDGIVMGAVNRCGTVDKLGEGERINVVDFGEGPVVTHGE
jgi:hypothetical protein